LDLDFETTGIHKASVRSNMIIIGILLMTIWRFLKR